MNLLRFSWSIPWSLLGWSHLHKLTQHTLPWDCLASRKLEPASKTSTSVDLEPQLGNGNSGNHSALVGAVPCPWEGRLSQQHLT